MLGGGTVQLGEKLEPRAYCMNRSQMRLRLRREDIMSDVVNNESKMMKIPLPSREYSLLTSSEKNEVDG